MKAMRLLRLAWIDLTRGEKEGAQNLKVVWASLGCRISLDGLRMSP